MVNDGLLVEDSWTVLMLPLVLACSRAEQVLFRSYVKLERSIVNDKKTENKMTDGVPMLLLMHDQRATDFT